MLHITWSFWLLLFTSAQTIYFLWLPPQSPSSSKSSGSTWNKCSHWLTLLLSLSANEVTGGECFQLWVSVCSQGYALDLTVQGPHVHHRPTLWSWPQPHLVQGNSHAKSTSPPGKLIWDWTPLSFSEWPSLPTNSSPSPQIKGSDVFCTVYGQLIHVLFNAFKALHFTPVTVEITHRQTDRQTDAPTQEESTLVVV